jgi:hypothetical protein
MGHRFFLRHHPRVLCKGGSLRPIRLENGNSGSKFVVPTPSAGPGQALAKTPQGWGAPRWSGADKNKAERWATRPPSVLELGRRTGRERSAHQPCTERRPIHLLFLVNAVLIAAIAPSRAVIPASQPKIECPPVVPCWASDSTGANLQTDRNIIISPETAIYL